MRFSAVVIAVVLLLADTASAVDHLIKVGANNALVFDPTDITAVVGDTVTFQFQGRNHSVTQSTFANPCTRQTMPSLGMNSGFMFVSVGTTTLPIFSFPIDDPPSPLWFFCAQINPESHCNLGMVFSVNAPSHQTFAQFQAAAKAAGGQTGPVTPTTGSNHISSSSSLSSSSSFSSSSSLSSSSSFSSSSSTTAAPTDSAAPTTTASVSTPVESFTTPTPTTPDPSLTAARYGDSNGPGTNKSKNIGLIVGGIVGGLMLVAACIYQQRRKRLRKSVDLDLAADSDSPLVVPFRSRPFRTAKRSPPSNADISPRMVMHEDSGVRLPPIGERFAPVVDVPPRYTSG